MTLNLTKAVKLYNKTGKGLRSIRQQILMLAYAFPRHKPYCTDEDCGEFLLSFYPRIDRIIHNFALRGTNFDAYLQSCFVWHMKTFIAKKFLQKRQDRIIYRDSCASLSPHDRSGWELHEESPPFMPQEQKEPLKKRDLQRIMLLTLKCAGDVNDSFINRIADRLGTNSAVIFHQVEILRTVMRDRTERIRSLSELRRQSYFLLHYLLDQRKGCHDKFRLLEIDKKIHKERRHIEYARRTLSITPKGPSNNDIARLLGVPKGTIDSGIYYLKGAGKRAKKFRAAKIPGAARKPKSLEGQNAISIDTVK